MRHLALAWLLPALCFATVRPSSEQLTNEAHLVVCAIVEDFSRVPYTGQNIATSRPKEEWSVRIRPAKARKGTPPGETFEIRYPMLDDKDFESRGFVLSEEKLRKLRGTKKLFYLRDRAKVKYSIPIDASGWGLVDDWFGMADC